MARIGKHNFFIKIVSVILLFALLIEVFPVSTFADEKAKILFSPTTYGIVDNSVDAYKLTLSGDATVVGKVGSSCLVVKSDVSDTDMKISVVGHAGIIKEYIVPLDFDTAIDWGDSICNLRDDLNNSKHEFANAWKNLCYIKNPLNEKYDLLNTSSGEYYDYAFDNVIVNQITSFYCPVEKDGLYGLIDTSGKLVYECIFSSAHYYDEAAEEILLVGEQNRVLVGPYGGIQSEKSFEIGDELIVAFQNGNYKYYSRKTGEHIYTCSCGTHWDVDDWAILPSGQALHEGVIIYSANKETEESNGGTGYFSAQDTFGERISCAGAGIYCFKEGEDVTYQEGNTEYWRNNTEATYFDARGKIKFTQQVFSYDGPSRGYLYGDVHKTIVDYSDFQEGRAIRRITESVQEQDKEEKVNRKYEIVNDSNQVLWELPVKYWEKIIIGGYVDSSGVSHNFSDRVLFNNDYLFIQSDDAVLVLNVSDKLNVLTVEEGKVSYTQGSLVIINSGDSKYLFSTKTGEYLKEDNSASSIDYVFEYDGGEYYLCDNKLYDEQLNVLATKDWFQDLVIADEGYFSDGEFIFDLQGKKISPPLYDDVSGRLNKTALLNNEKIYRFLEDERIIYADAYGNKIAGPFDKTCVFNAGYGCGFNNSSDWWGTTNDYQIFDEQGTLYINGQYRTYISGDRNIYDSSGYNTQILSVDRGHAILPGEPSLYESSFYFYTLPEQREKYPDGAIQLVESFPQNGAQEVSLQAGDIDLIFDRDVHFFTSTGNIEIKEYDSDKTVLTYSAALGNKIGEVFYKEKYKKVSLKNALSVLDRNTKYYITIGPDCFYEGKPQTDNKKAFQGIQDKNTLSFTTENETTYFSDMTFAAACELSSFNLNAYVGQNVVDFVEGEGIDGQLIWNTADAPNIDSTAKSYGLLFRSQLAGYSIADYKQASNTMLGYLLLKNDSDKRAIFLFTGNLSKLYVDFNSDILQKDLKNALELYQSATTKYKNDGYAITITDNYLLSVFASYVAVVTNSPSVVFNNLNGLGEDLAYLHGYDSINTFYGIDVHTHKRYYNQNLPVFPQKGKGVNAYFSTRLSSNAKVLPTELRSIYSYNKGFKLNETAGTVNIGRVGRKRVMSVEESANAISKAGKQYISALEKAESGNVPGALMTIFSGLIELDTNGTDLILGTSGADNISSRTHSEHLTEQIIYTGGTEYESDFFSGGLNSNIFNHTNGSATLTGGARTDIYIMNHTTGTVVIKDMGCKYDDAKKLIGALKKAVEIRASESQPLGKADEIMKLLEKLSASGKTTDVVVFPANSITSSNIKDAGKYYLVQTGSATTYLQKRALSDWTIMGKDGNSISTGEVASTLRASAFSGVASIGTNMAFSESGVPSVKTLSAGLGEEDQKSKEAPVLGIEEGESGTYTSEVIIEEAEDINENGTGEEAEEKLMDGVETEEAAKNDAEEEEVTLIGEDGRNDLYEVGDAASVKERTCESGHVVFAKSNQAQIELFDLDGESVEVISSDSAEQVGLNYSYSIDEDDYIMLYVDDCIRSASIISGNIEDVQFFDQSDLDYYYEFTDSKIDEIDFGTHEAMYASVNLGANRKESDSSLDSELLGITVVPSNRLVYGMDEEISRDDITVYAYYSNGTCNVIEDYQFVPFEKELGTVNVEVVYEDEYAGFDITCVEEDNIVKDIQLPAEITLKAGECKKLQYIVEPKSINESYLIISTTNPSVLDIRSGYLIALKEGTATVSVSNLDGTIVAESVVRIGDGRSVETKKENQSITVKAGASALAVGKTTSLSASGAKGKVSYKSSDTSVATVDSSGKVTAKKVGTVSITVTAAETENYNVASKTVSIKVVPAATSSVSTANQAKGIKVSWKKVTGATGYLVYRNGNQIKKVTNGNTVTFTDTKATGNGSKYVYKIVAYAGTGNSTLSKSVTTYQVARPNISKLTNSGAKKMTVKWGKNTKATGYQIQYSTNSKFAKGNKTATITKKTTISKTITKLAKGKTYYVRIRTYKTVGGKKYYSAWSTAKKVRIKK